MILENISGPQDLKKLTIEELQTLADETREVLLEKISSHGGHSGPNLGMVEMTVALHYVFDINDTVIHKKFGEGTVLDITSDSVKIEFSEVGTKTLLIEYANLTRKE